MKKPSLQKTILKSLLKHRYERLFKWIRLQAPYVAIINEIRLIAEADRELHEKYPEDAERFEIETPAITTDIHNFEKIKCHEIKSVEHGTQA